MSYEEFKQAIFEFEITPIHVNGEPAGALLVKDADVHACVLRKFKGRWFTRRVFGILNRLVEKHGYAQTSATTKDGEAFVQRLGFTKHGNEFRRYTKWA